MNNPMEKAKKKYDETEIPDELAEGVQVEIKHQDSKRRRGVC